MTKTSRLVSSASAVTVFFVLSALSGFAQGRHPGYLHALTDLRHARAHLERPDGGALRREESDAIHEIDKAIDEIKRASIDDGKNLSDHPPVDARLGWPGRLHRALELTNKAHNDVAQEEDNVFAQGLQLRALEHIDKAHRHVEEALAVAEGR
jgi:hypothetical protein